MPHTAKDYWDSNLDPFGHRLPRTEDLNREWEKAFRTYESPDIVCAWALMGDVAGRNVLELGAGLGCGAIRLALRGAAVTGLDLSEERCRTAEAIRQQLYPDCRVVFRAGNAAAMPLEDESHDVVFARDVLMYAQPAKVVAECKRILRPGGKAVFDEALRGNPFVGTFRSLFADREHRRIGKYLGAGELGALGGGLAFRESRFFYLVSSLAFFMLYAARSETAYRLALRALYPVDRLLIGRFPGTRRWAWRGVALYRKE